MTKLHLLAVVAGLLFGVWPLLMNRSGLNGPVSATTFAFFSCVTVLPFAIYTYDKQVVAGALWKYALAAGMVAGFGVLAFNTMLAKTTPQNVGTYFVIVLLVQIAVPAVYHVVMTGEYSPKQLAGFAVAAIAVILLK